MSVRPGSWKCGLELGPVPGGQQRMKGPILDKVIDLPPFDGALTEILRYDER